LFPRLVFYFLPRPILKSPARRIFAASHPANFGKLLKNMPGGKDFSWKMPGV
jgi:hypothetical protein